MTNSDLVEQLMCWLFSVTCNLPFVTSVPVGNNQRQEYTSPLQVAAATGQPILAPGHMGTQTQPITAVQISPNMMSNTPQPYQVTTSKVWLHLSGFCVCVHLYVGTCIRHKWLNIGIQERLNWCAFVSVVRLDCMMCEWPPLKGFLSGVQILYIILKLLI